MERVEKLLEFDPDLLERVVDFVLSAEEHDSADFMHDGVLLARDIREALDEE